MNPEEQATLQKVEALVANYPVVIFIPCAVKPRR